MSADELLEAVAAALNACRDAGIRVKLAHGAAYTSAGYVLPINPGKRYRAIPMAEGPACALDPDLDDIFGLVP